MENSVYLPWKRDISSVPPEILKGRLHESVVDSADNVIALCGEDDLVVEFIVHAANGYNALIEALKSFMEIAPDCTEAQLYECNKKAIKALRLAGK